MKFEIAFLYDVSGTSFRNDKCLNVTSYKSKSDSLTILSRGCFNKTTMAIATIHLFASLLLGTSSFR